MKRLWLLILIVGLSLLAACNGNKENTSDEEDVEELKELEVDFEIPENAEVGETIEVKATVTYGDELVDDADEVNFEYWIEGDKDNSQTIDSINHGDGTYTAEITLEDEAVYTMYAHTTARSLHTMPKKSVLVGNAQAENEHEHGHEHVEGFEMHFMNPEDAQAGKETELMVHLQLHEKPLENAQVRYEVWNYDISEKHDWIEVKEQTPGEYVVNHIFEKEGTYHIQVHVENDELHEHEEYEVKVSK